MVLTSHTWSLYQHLWAHELCLSYALNLQSLSVLHQRCSSLQFKHSCAHAWPRTPSVTLALPCDHWTEPGSDV